MKYDISCFDYIKEELSLAKTVVHHVTGWRQSKDVRNNVDNMTFEVVFEFPDGLTLPYVGYGIPGSDNDCMRELFTSEVMRDAHGGHLTFKVPVKEDMLGEVKYTPTYLVKFTIEDGKVKIYQRESIAPLVNYITQFAGAPFDATAYRITEVAFREPLSKLTTQLLDIGVPNKASEFGTFFESGYIEVNMYSGNNMLLKKVSVNTFNMCLTRSLRRALKDMRHSLARFVDLAVTPNWNTKFVEIRFHRAKKNGEHIEFTNFSMFRDENNEWKVCARPLVNPQSFAEIKFASVIAEDSVEPHVERIMDTLAEMVFKVGDTRYHLSEALQNKLRYQFYDFESEGKGLVAIVPPKPNVANVPQTVLEDGYRFYVGRGVKDYLCIGAELSFPKTMDPEAIRRITFSEYTANVSKSKAVYTWDCQGCKLTLSVVALVTPKHSVNYNDLANKYVRELLEKYK